MYKKIIDVSFLLCFSFLLFSCASKYSQYVGRSYTVPAELKSCAVLTSPCQQTLGDYRLAYQIESLGGGKYEIQGTGIRLKKDAHTTISHGSISFIVVSNGVIAGAFDVRIAGDVDNLKYSKAFSSEKNPEQVIAVGYSSYITDA